MDKIMFNKRFGLEQAVLDGIKTQMRRIVSESLIDDYENWLDDVMCIAVPSGTTYEKIEDFLIKRSKYVVGEIVAIAQSYKDLGYSETALDISPKDYRIVRGTLGQSKGWNNKMFVRADACKHYIRITNVKIEHLQDISDEDCLKEGIMKWDAGQKDIPFYTYPNAKIPDFDTPREAYASLIDKLGKRGDWDSNPYVWVYDFELIK